MAKIVRPFDQSSNSDASNAQWQDVSTEHKDEIKAQIQQDLQAIDENRIEDAILVNALAGNWSMEHFNNVARQRGKSWRFLSALGDRALEIAGIAMLHYEADAKGHALREGTVAKALGSLRRINDLEAKYVKRNGDDPYAAQIFQDARGELVEQGPERRESYRQKINKMLSE